MTAEAHGQRFLARFAEGNLSFILLANTFVKLKGEFIMPNKISKTKRLFSLGLAFLICFALLPGTVQAAEPFPTVLEAPDNVLLGQAPEDHGGYINVSFNKSPELSAMIDEGRAVLERYGLDYINYYVQIDWFIDSKDDWKYHPNWDELKTHTGDAWFEGEYVRKTLNSDTTQREMIFYFSLKADPNSSAWKEWLTHLKEGQYYVNQYGNPRIDWKQHTLYVRTRFVIAYRPSGGSDLYLISDWSLIAAYGKDYKLFEIPKSLEAPTISDLKLTNRQVNGGPVVAFNLTNPQSVKEASAGAKSLMDYIVVVAEVSIGGGEWKQVNLSDRDITDGYLYAELARVAESVSEDTHVKLRARYQYHKGNGTLVLASDWSNVVEFGAPAWGKASQWATAELKKADTLGLIPESLRGADLTKPITRAEFAAVCVKVFEALSGTKAIPAINNPFTDTRDIEVLKAYNLGITTGTAADKFSPDMLLNREQAATMLTRVFKRVSIPGWSIQTDSQFTLNYTKPEPFADDAKISGWARESVYFMVANDIIKGTGNNMFSPRATTPAEEAANYATVTREQALVIAVRMVENLG